MTYKQFVDMKKEDKIKMLKDLTIKVSGVKGKWADFVKKQLVKKLMVLYNNGVCTLCIVGRLEQEYDPTKFLYDTSSFDSELSHVMEECVHECQKDN
jgi:saccharopine dehydrogenase-like NADP-dependent oxidoreductase